MATNFKKNNEVTSANDVVSAQDAGLSEEENAATADIVDAAPQDATVSSSATVIEASDLARLMAGCCTRTAGFGIATILDDAHRITGSLTGTNRRSVSYTADTQPATGEEFCRRLRPPL